MYCTPRSNTTQAKMIPVGFALIDGVQKSVQSRVSDAQEQLEAETPALRLLFLNFASKNSIFLKNERSSTRNSSSGSRFQPELAISLEHILPTTCSVP
jgi:hypothetical protein